MSGRIILVWFRNDLRSHDNEVLVRALEQGNQMIPVYCFDPRHYAFQETGIRKTGVLRAEFIRRNVQALRDVFRQAGGDLFVTHGPPAEVLPALCERWKVDEVYHHREVAFEETEVSGKVETALWKQQINLRHFIGHTLYHKEDLPYPIKDIPDSFSQFRKKTERESSVRPGFEKPTTYRFAEFEQDSVIPTLSELGYEAEEIALTENLTLRGGEEAAFLALDQFIETPQAFDHGTGLSPYVSVGSLSPNTYYHKLTRAIQTQGQNKALKEQLQQLLWRDYFRFMFKKHGNRFFQAGGITGQIPESTSADEDVFERWTRGETGVKLIDDSMKRLRTNGLISGLQRSVSASYFVHEMGGDWLKGAAWFEDKLLDYNPCTNYGNWAHIAGVGSSTRENKPMNLDKLLDRE